MRTLLLLIPVIIVAGCAAPREYPAGSTIQGGGLVHAKVPSDSVLVNCVIAEVDASEARRLLSEGFRELHFVAVDRLETHRNLSVGEDNGRVRIVSRPTQIVRPGADARILLDGRDDWHLQLSVDTIETPTGMFYVIDADVAQNGDARTASISGGSPSGHSTIATTWQRPDGNWAVLLIGLTRLP